MKSNIKLCTDHKQSEKLKKILPPITSDMSYDWFIIGKEYSSIPQCRKFIDDELPCWSLSALLEDVLPNKIVVNNLGYEKSCNFSFSDNKWYLSYDDVTFRTLVTIVKESLLDACYEMILELHEMNLL